MLTKEQLKERLNKKASRNTMLNLALNRLMESYDLAHYRERRCELNRHIEKIIHSMVK